MEYHSVHFVPDSRMNRMDGIRFIRNIQNTRFLWESFGAKSYAAARARRHSSSQVTSAMGIPFPDFRSVLFEIEIPCILLFLNLNTNN